MGRDGGCTLERVVGMEMVGATGGASKARMPEMNAQRLCRTQSQQSVHKEARVMVQGEGWMFFQNGCEDGEGRCNGRGKPTPLRKVGGIVRFWKGQCQCSCNDKVTKILTPCRLV